MPAAVLRAAGGAVLVASLSAGLLTGCRPGDGSSGGDAAGSASASPSSSASPSAPSGSPTPSAGRPSKSPPPAPSPSGSGGTITVRPPGGDLDTHRGTVTRGTEPGCLILRSSDGQFELVGAGDQARQVLRPDAQVVVRGYREKGLMSHCMQGKIFKVVSAKKTS